MQNRSVSTCANPSCGAEFKRLGDGKLFVRPARKEDNGGLTQKVLWLCAKCTQDFDLKYDRRKQIFQLVRNHRAA
ncbi:MAG TPA: hypothetical protein VF786_14945 [Terriglobales bacterium]